MSVREQVEALIQEQMERGIPRERAAANVFKADPSLRERLVDEANDRDPRQR